MHEPRSQRIAGQHSGVRQQRVDERAVARAVGGMADHPRGLVDDKERLVFENDVERDLFGLRVECERLGDRELEQVPVGNRGRLLRQGPVKTNASGTNGTSDLSARRPRETCDRDVAARPRLIGSHAV
jgi:hypothetical protein